MQELVHINSWILITCLFTESKPPFTGPVHGSHDMWRVTSTGLKKDEILFCVLKRTSNKKICSFRERKISKLLSPVKESNILYVYYFFIFQERCIHQKWCWSPSSNINSIIQHYYVCPVNKKAFFSTSPTLRGSVY